MIARVARIYESVNLLVGSEITVQGSEVPHIIRLWDIRIKKKQNSSEKVDRGSEVPRVRGWSAWEVWLYVVVGKYLLPCSDILKKGQKIISKWLINYSSTKIFLPKFVLLAKWSSIIL